MTNQPTAIHPSLVTASRPARWRALGRNLWRNQAGPLGMIVVALLIFMAVAAPLLAPHDPTDQDLKLRLLPRPGLKRAIGRIRSAPITLGATFLAG